MQLTARDEQMLDWLGIVGMADIDAVQWALAGLRGTAASRPVTTRRANQWIARMAQADLVGRARPIYREHQVIWPTRLASGRNPRRLFRQTMRHELAVAFTSARYLAHGYSWSSDREARLHRADGMAIRGECVELIEVELTPKKLSRYRGIHADHARRLASGEVTRVVYLCTSDAARTVSDQADRFLFREQRPQLTVFAGFDEQGSWGRTHPGPWAQVS